MRRLNFYKHYLGDYARDTAHLSLMEHGAYRVLLDSYYATERALPVDKGALYRICKAFNAAERKAVDKVAAEFFPVDTTGDGLRHNRRADEEITKRGTQAETNRFIAEERERRRKEHELSTNRATNVQPIHSQIPEKTKTLSPPEGAFLDFWTAWPKNDRKGAKGKCWVLWRREKFEALAEQIITHVERMKTTDGWHRGFIPAPLVYLGERRWEGAEEGSPQPGKLAI